MIKFWQQKSIFNYLLLPFSYVWLYFTYKRLANGVGRCSPSLVVCVGNIVVGGAGKTPFTVYLAKMLLKEKVKVAILTKGYKSKVKGTLLVNPNLHSADLVGDEPLLLAQVAPTLIAKDRVEGLDLLDEDYQVILMDDGMQNGALVKDITFTLFDTSVAMGNEMVIPAGPLREPLRDSSSRITAVVGVGAKNPELEKTVASLELKYYRAQFVPNLKENKEFLLSKKYLAFAGIGNPDKFFQSLRDYGLRVVLTKTYPDHYPYTNKDIKKLIKLAKSKNLQLITTSKDYVKISAEHKPQIINFAVELELNQSSANEIKELLMRKLREKSIMVNP